MGGGAMVLRIPKRRKRRLLSGSLGLAIVVVVEMNEGAWNSSAVIVTAVSDRSCFDGSGKESHRAANCIYISIYLSIYLLIFVAVTVLIKGEPYSSNAKLY